MGELFEDIFYSARLGVLKPEPAYFSAIEARIGPQSEPPLFFDDREEVIAAASAFGWDAVLYDDHQAFLQHPWIAERLGQLPDMSSPPADESLDSGAKLPYLLRKLLRLPPG